MSSRVDRCRAALAEISKIRGSLNAMEAILREEIAGELTDATSDELKETPIKTLMDKYLPEVEESKNAKARVHFITDGLALDGVTTVGEFLAFLDKEQSNRRQVRDFFNIYPNAGCLAQGVFFAALQLAGVNFGRVNSGYKNLIFTFGTV